MSFCRIAGRCESSFQRFQEIILHFNRGALLEEIHSDQEPCYAPAHYDCSFQAHQSALFYPHAVARCQSPFHGQRSVRID